MSEQQHSNLTARQQWWQQRLHTHDKQPPPVLIVGMHNSGTSILAKILSKNGLFLGANLADLYESYFFSMFINDNVIMGGGSNWSQLPIMSVPQVMSNEPFVGPFIRKYWSGESRQWGYDGVSKWGIKDPRLCVLLPLYLEIFPGASVVHVRRDPKDIAASLCGKFKTGVGILNDFDHWLELAGQYTQRVLDYSGQVQAYHEIRYEEFCQNPETVTRGLFDFLELQFTEETGEQLQEVHTSSIGSWEKYRKTKTKNTESVE